MLRRIAFEILRRVRPLYAEDPFRLDIDNMVYAFDSSTISLCLKLCPWAKFRTTKAGIKIIKLTGVKPSRCYPETLRMVTYKDFATGKVYRFLTNHWGYEALTIAELYRERWNVELSICVI